MELQIGFAHYHFDHMSRRRGTMQALVLTAPGYLIDIMDR